MGLSPGERIQAFCGPTYYNRLTHVASSISFLRQGLGSEVRGSGGLGLDVVHGLRSFRFVITVNWDAFPSLLPVRDEIG